VFGLIYGCDRSYVFDILGNANVSGLSGAELIELYGIL